MFNQKKLNNGAVIEYEINGDIKIKIELADPPFASRALIYGAFEKDALSENTYTIINTKAEQFKNANFKDEESFFNLLKQLDLEKIITTIENLREKPGTSSLVSAR